MLKLRKILDFLVVSTALIYCIALIIGGTVEKLSSEITPWNFFQHVSALQLFLWSFPVYFIGALGVLILGKLGK